MGIHLLQAQDSSTPSSTFLEKDFLLNRNKGKIDILFAPLSTNPLNIEDFLIPIFNNTKVSI